MSEGASITKHAIALSLIAKHSRITALELGAVMSRTERSVRKIVLACTPAVPLERKINYSDTQKALVG